MAADPGDAPRIAPGGRRDVGAFAWTFGLVAGRVAGTTRRTCS